MSFSDSHEEMSLVELHGIQLRMATDELEQETYLVHARSTHAIDMAELLLKQLEVSSAATE
jgi:hypothetical protein